MCRYGVLRSGLNLLRIHARAPEIQDDVGNHRPGLLFQYLILEPIRFFIQSIDYATWPQEDPPYRAEEGGPTMDHIGYLKIRLRSLRSELLISEGHTNEMLNQKYKHIAGDLLLYGSYFIALMLMVVLQEDHTNYYNTNNMQRLFWDNTSVTFGLSQVYFIYQARNVFCY